MKKYLFAFIIISGCSGKPETPSGIVNHEYTIVVIDSCEYVIVEFGKHTRAWSYSITHKGNCHKCKNTNPTETNK